MAKHKYIESPEKFWELFVEFRTFKLSQKIKQEVTSRTGIETINHTPPLTWAGFDAWLYEHKVIKDTGDYRTNEKGKYDDFSEVIRVISNIMYAQKFEGASVGVFNANIIARDLGLKDSTETNVKVEQPLFSDVPKNNNNK